MGKDRVYVGELTGSDPPNFVETPAKRGIGTETLQLFFDKIGTSLIQCPHCNTFILWKGQNPNHTYGQPREKKECV
jgi:DNA-directed RNA polymerase subunit RPC12/RpoP